MWIPINKSADACTNHQAITLPNVQLLQISKKITLPYVQMLQISKKITLPYVQMLQISKTACDSVFHQILFIIF